MTAQLGAHSSRPVVPWLRVLRLVMATIVLAGSLPAGAFAQDVRPSAAIPTSSEQQPTLSDAVDAAIAAAGEELAGGPTSQLMGDPAVVRAYVATHITPETYDGVLKGARGAFLTGAANSADQSLLMAALLGATGTDRHVRFALCEPLSAETVAETASTAPEPGHLVLDRADEIAAQITDPDLKAAILALRAFRDRSAVRAATGAQALWTALVAGAHPWTAVPPSPPSAARHVWLQVEQDGSWVDLDPSTVSGVSPCQATENFDALPASLDHRVAFRVTVERQVAGALETSTALEAESATSTLAASRIAFGFGEPIGLIGRVPDDAADELPYTPVLRIDNQTVAGTPLLLPRIVATSDEGVGGFDAFGGFDGTLGADGSPTPEPDPVTAVWLDTVLTAPDGGAVTIRSDVFDRIGIVARTDGTAASAVPEPLPQVSGEYAAMDTMWQIGLLLGEIRAPETTVAPFLDIITVDGLSGTIDALLRLFPALQRDMGGDSGVPIVLLAGMGPVAGPAKRGGLVPGEVATQLVLDAIHVPTSAPADPAEAARRAQATITAEGMLVAIAGGTVDPLGDADQIFAAARKASTPLLTVLPGDTPQVAGASPQALARMTARIRDGYVLLTPAAAPSVYSTARTAWWYVDPATGVIRDELENGRHSGLDEYAGTTSKVSTRYERFCAFAVKMRLPIAVAAFALAAATGFDPKTGGAFLKGVGKVGSALYERKKKADEALKLACPGDAPPGPPLP